MANQQVSLVLNLCFLVLLLSNSIQADSDDNRKAYVVYMGHNTRDHTSASSLYLSMLQVVTGSRDAANHMLHSYTKSFNGFSAMLTQEEAQKLSGMEGVVSVFPSRNNKLATTTSWDFLGFPLTAAVNISTTESDVIVGVIDSGIWPESASFSDHGYGPPPAKWKGKCERNFPCNKKIIGARQFRARKTYGVSDIQSPKDADGHGTHTASTAAGNIVHNANLHGLRSGTARGGMPRARIAVYKVCWLLDCRDDDVLCKNDSNQRCTDHDIFAAFDAAIADGVDIISISINLPFAVELSQDTIALGSFHAMHKGILTVQSAGNEGPRPQTINSVAPWVLSAAASTKNPDLITPVKLGNNMVVDGLSINPITLPRMYPLVYAGDVPNTMANFTGSISRFCYNDSLDKNLVKGKIILCEGTQSNGDAEKSAGVVGSIMSGEMGDGLNSYPLPVSVVNPDQANSIFQYIRSTSDATATISKSKDADNDRTPYVASFSSRGPNPIYINILKPDLTAPGVNILAAWSPKAPITKSKTDKKAVAFNMISGTSMACPHVSGIAAYIKTFHPTWSPAAIKSALMTTASPMNAEINTDAEFAYGAGNLNPMKALRPGLVYDAGEVDYVSFLCQEGYTTRDIRIITGDNSSSCSQLIDQTKVLNYPTFVIPTLQNMPIDLSFNRTVTNVGSARSTYRALITQPPVSIFAIQVEPSVLRFEEYGQKLSFMVSVQAIILKLDNPIVSGGLTWDDGVHQVRSPIVVHIP